MNARGGASGAAAVRLSAGADAAGERLDRFLAARMPEFSRARVQALIAAGAVRITGADAGAGAGEKAEAAALSPARKMREGETVEVFPPPPEPARPAAQAIPLDVVYEDPHLLVINKPAGLVTHPAPGNRDSTLVNAVLGRLAARGEPAPEIGGAERPGIVHRLDKDTSGLMAVAKTDAAHQGLAAQFEARTVERAYLAVLCGAPSPPSGEIDAPIGRDPRNRKRMAVVRRGGKPAVTRYKTKKLFGAGFSLAECRLLSGRTHQIRVHMAHIGCPVAGDPLYGGRRRQRGAAVVVPAPVPVAAPAPAGQLLQAYLLGFVHPVTGEKLSFRADVCARISAFTDALDN
ncbi:MAG: RluA family pseudouridine synthase [Rhodospirillales bacterium]